MYKKKIIICLLLVALFQFPLYAGNTVTLNNSTTANPTGTYTTDINLLDGFTQMRGIVVVNSQNSPTASIVQAVDKDSALTNAWHGTDTISFEQSGSIWRGVINVKVFGKYGRLSVGSFGTATFSKINWYASFETTVTSTINIATVATGSGTAVSVGTSSVKFLESNTNRKYLSIQNTGNSDYYISFGSPAGSSTSPMLIYGNGGLWETSNLSVIYSGALYGIADTGATTLRIIEF